MQLSEVTLSIINAPSFPSSSGFSPGFFVLFIVHRPLSELYYYSLSKVSPVLVRFRYLCTFFCSSSTLMSLGTAISIKSAVLLYDYNICPSVFNHVVYLDTYIPEDITFSISITGSVLCQYHCSEHGRPYFSHRLQWTILATAMSLLILQLCQLAAFIRLSLPCPCTFCISVGNFSCISGTVHEAVLSSIYPSVRRIIIIIF